MAVPQEACTNCELQLTSTKNVFLGPDRFLFDGSSYTGLTNQSSSIWSHLKGLGPNQGAVKKDCISYCSLHHNSCKPQRTHEAPIFFRVIDCKTRQVTVAEPRCQYLALSYVWGAPARTFDQNPGLDNCPKVINDSIDVTLMLNFQYLWVDRYCIDQLDAEDKHHQIQQMDLIYTHAVATIIAAAGDDPGYGLPEVNGTLRKPQPQLRIRVRLLASSLPHPSVSVNRSKWATRVWMYQESILSRRRIIFTDEQVLFECNSMHCTESQSSILEELHSNDDKSLFAVNPAASALKWKTPTWNSSEIIYFLAESSKRELSYPADAINAMQGIFQMFSRSDFPVHHLECVPIVSTAAGSFHQELSFLKGLSWYHESPGERRLEFPSWSWAGWTGQLGSSFTRRDSVPQIHTITAVDLETKDKEFEKSPLEETAEAWQDFMSRLADIRVHTIRIHGETLRCKVVHTIGIGRRSTGQEDFMTAPIEMDSYEPEDDYSLEFEVDNNILVYLRTSWDIDGSQLLGKALKCICLSDTHGYQEHGNLNSMLVVQEGTDGLAERVGCCHFETRYAQVDGEWVYSSSPRYWNLLFKKMKQETIRLG